MSSVVHQNSGDSPCLRANVACHQCPSHLAPGWLGASAECPCGHPLPTEPPATLQGGVEGSPGDKMPGTGGT